MMFTAKTASPKGFKSGFFVLFVLLGPTPTVNEGLWAQSIVAPGGRTLFSGASLIRSDLQLLQFSGGDGRQNRDINQYVPVTALVYGILPQWSVIVSQPWISRDMTTRLDGITRRENFNGLGDTNFFLQYDGLYRRNTPGGLTRLSATFGLEAPIGSRSFSSDAFAYTFGLIFEKMADLKNFVSSDFEYKVATENDDRVSRGDQARFDVVFSRFVIPRNRNASSRGSEITFGRLFRHGAFFILELNGTWQRHARVSGLEISDSGGVTLFLSPGIQYFLNNRFLLEFSAPIPVL